ncbi:MAG: methyltransferase domain-containing protein [archaeon]|nr:methyltransferase domain-containing protein [archaeon]
MKFQSTPYHLDLLKDKDRLSIFYEAISTLNLDSKELAYDLGCGSGILSYFAQEYFDKVISIEMDSKAYNYAKLNLTPFANIEVVNSDVLDFNFNEKADLIICEMLDTALIDEEQVPVINKAREFLKEKGKLIPEAVFNHAQLVNMERDYVHYDDGDSFTKFEVLSNKIKYSEIDFYKEIDSIFEDVIQFKIKEDSKINKVNGLMITTITKLTDNIVSGPTPMSNPPLLIPLDEFDVKPNELVDVKLTYQMGGGIESINLLHI